MLQDLVELISIVLRPEPLDTEIEQRCKLTWEEATCPEYGETAILSRRLVSGSGVPTVDMALPTPITLLSKDARSHLKILSSRLPYTADTPLSIHQIARLFDAAYDTVHTTIREVEAGLEAASTSPGNASNRPSTGKHRSTKPITSAQATRDRRRRGAASPAAAPVIAVDHGGRLPL